MGSFITIYTFGITSVIDHARCQSNSHYQRKENEREKGSPTSILYNHLVSKDPNQTLVMTMLTSNHTSSIFLNFVNMYLDSLFLLKNSMKVFQSWSIIILMAKIAVSVIGNDKERFLQFVEIFYMKNRRGGIK